MGLDAMENTDVKTAKSSISLRSVIKDVKKMIGVKKVPFLFMEKVEVEVEDVTCGCERRLLIVEHPDLFFFEQTSNFRI